MPGTYGKTWWREGYACGCMIQSIEQVIEPRLRAAGYLGTNATVNIFQQSYSSSVSASAGTHGGGGSLDHEKGSDGETTIWRECGVASWQRGPDHDYSFDDHNHSIWQGCPHLSGDAAGQIDQYEAGCNGLADWGADESPHVAPISWQEAFDKYVGDNPPEDEGLFGMTKRISKYRGDSQAFQTDDWGKTLATDNDGGATIAVNTNGMVDVIVYVTSGLADGDEISFRWQYLGIKGDSTNVDWQSSVLSYRSDGSAGNVQLVHHFDLKPEENGWDHKLRLAINTNGKKVTFGAIETKGWED